MTIENMMMPRLTRLAGWVFVAVAAASSACKEDGEGTLELRTDTAQTGDAGAPAAQHAGAEHTGAEHARPRSGVREGAGGTDVGDLGVATGDIDTIIDRNGGDGGPAVVAPAPRDLGKTESEANWRPEGLRVAYSGPKLPCDGSLILKSAPIDDTTASVTVVDVNAGRVPVDCKGPTTLSIVISDVPRSVSTVRFYTPDGAMQTVSVIGAQAIAPAKETKAKAKKH